MAIRKIQSSTVTFILVGIAVIAMGAYTDNDGFHLAGGIFLVVGNIAALNDVQSRGKNNS